jgi:oxygen-dependent protoporphyrinogen oxidase
MIEKDLHTMLKFPQGTKPDMIRIFRHQQAIPQYEASSGKRFEAIDNIQQQYKGLILGGNIKGGIGMADRIRQAFQLAELIK